MLTPDEAKRLKELLNKGKATQDGYHLYLSRAEHEEFRGLVIKGLDEGELKLFQDYLAFHLRLKASLDEMERKFHIYFFQYQRRQEKEGGIHV